MSQINLEAITNNIKIDKKFVLIEDSTKYTDDALTYILSKVTEADAIAFIANTGKIWAKGQYYNDLDSLKYFTGIAAYNSDGELVNGMNAPTGGATLNIQGKGLTSVSTDATSGTIVINTDTEAIDEYISNLGNDLAEMANTYASKDYVNEYFTTNVSGKYQNTLTAGAYISITDDNVINTYNLVDFSYLSANYADLTSFNTLSQSFEDYKELMGETAVSEEYVITTANNAAAAAVSKLVNGAPAAFDTLKEIADWLVNSGEYTAVTSEQITANPKDKYYVKDENNNYVDATYGEDGNVIVTDGQTLYVYTSVSAAEIVDTISSLTNEVGTPHTYTYVDGTGKTQQYTGSTLTPVAETPGTYIGEVNGEPVTVTSVASTGLYKAIDDNYNELNNKIATLSGNINNALYDLYAASNSSYVSLTINPETYEGASSRSIELTVSEASFDTTNGQITNGLPTANTVNAMIDYRNGWVVL